MSFGMLLFLIGAVGTMGTLIWIFLDCVKMKKKEDALIYEALEQSYGGDTEKLKEVHTTLQFSQTVSTKKWSRKNEWKTKQNPKPVSKISESTEIETELLTEKR